MLSPLFSRTRFRRYKSRRARGLVSTCEQRLDRICRADTTSRSRKPKTHTPTQPVFIKTHEKDRAIQRQNTLSYTHTNSNRPPDAIATPDLHFVSRPPTLAICILVHHSALCSEHHGSIAFTRLSETPSKPPNSRTTLAQASCQSRPPEPQSLEPQRPLDRLSKRTQRSLQIPIAARACTAHTRTRTRTHKAPLLLTTTAAATTTTTTTRSRHRIASPLP